MDNCKICNKIINSDLTGEPVLVYMDSVICDTCYIGLIDEIYKMAGMGDGGMIHLIFQDCLTRNNNRKRRRTMPNYKNILKKLLYKYKFKCVFCEENSEKKLTIDHINPVSKGGSDDFLNLQILCRSCNSKKSNK